LAVDKRLDGHGRGLVKANVERVLFSHILFSINIKQCIYFGFKIRVK